MNKENKNKVNNIMENFNFENVHKIMTILNWKWSMGNGEERVPSLHEIKKEAKRMLEDAVQGNCYSTGGFETSNEYLLTLKFCLEEWCA